MGAEYLEGLKKLLILDEPTTCTRTHNCGIDGPCNGYPRVWTDVDAFGEWVASMWFSGETREMTERELSIMGLGIAGEAGEVVEKIKKDIRDGADPRVGGAILKELGDVLYYTIRIGQFYGYKPSDILKANYEKLTSRKARGTERGSGDNR